MKLIVREKEKIEAKDHALYFGAFVGCNGVFNTGGRIGINVVSANSVKLSDGIVQIHGRPLIIYPNETVSLIIENGTQSMKRHDLIVAEFAKTSTDESMVLKVLKGVPSSSIAADPPLKQQDTLSSGTVYQLPLYRVRLNGINIEGTDDLRTYIADVADLHERSLYYTDTEVTG